MTSLGSKIALYRKKLSLTQEELAEKCSVTPHTVSKWENDISAPDIALIPVLAQLFGISCDELLGVETEQVRAVPQQLVDLNKVLLKIKVDSAEGDKVNLNLPIMLAEPFLKNVNVSGKDALRGIDFAQLIELVKSGAVGKIMEVNSADGDVVEIWVE